MRLGSSGLGELLGVVWELWRSESMAIGREGGREGEGEGEGTFQHTLVKFQMPQNPLKSFYSSTSPAFYTQCTQTCTHTCTHMYMKKGLGIYLENCEKLAATRD